MASTTNVASPANCAQRTWYDLGEPYPRDITRVRKNILPSRTRMAYYCSYTGPGALAGSLIRSI
ncbi:hypothetical protein NQ318_021007 [Aromia moschata]|uniref:Uncharacterized protein n=1 Tax=Aromia moschata TaxID=1265417 RepID=A0AAV8YMA5_9CUCU|nr:hypothetical protein NQ318_021007 [Aromia moschata]